MSRILSAVPVNIGLVQISFDVAESSYFPYSVGILQAYAKAHAKSPDSLNFFTPVFRRSSVSEIASKLRNSDIVGFSVYVWNMRISIEAARQLNQLNPCVTIVFGGPNVPNNAEAFLRRNHFIDLVVHGEGERSFVKILDQYPSFNFDLIESSSHIGSDGKYHTNRVTERISDLDTIPSPYLTGVFDRLIEEYPNRRWVGLWETNRGCPYKCTFCEWGAATASKVKKYHLSRLKSEIDWFSVNKIELIVCCDGNFGMLDRDIEIAKCVAAKKVELGFPKMLSVQTSKNATNRSFAVHKILADANLSVGVGLSMQSLDEQTLINIRRNNISINTYFELQNRFNEEGIDTYCDLIIGLPGETYNSFADGAMRLIDNGQHDRIRFNNLSILPNAEMADSEYKAKYGINTVESVIVVPGPRDGVGQEVSEMQDLVISTDALPPQDWRRARVFGWLVGLLHFDKLMQIPFVVARNTTSITYRQMIEMVLDVDQSFPVTAGVRDFLFEHALAIQNGRPEYPFSEQWSNVYWSTNQYVFIKLTAEGKLGQFLSELAELLRRLLAHSDNTALDAVDDAIALNIVLVRQFGVITDVEVKISYDIIGFYKSCILGRRSRLVQRNVVARIVHEDIVSLDFDDWFRNLLSHVRLGRPYLHSFDVVRFENVKQGKL